VSLPVPFPTQPATASETISSITVPNSGGAVTRPISILSGFAVTESTGSASASMRLYDGTSASGVQLTPLIKLAAGATYSGEGLPDDIAIQSGEIFIQIVTGSIEGVVYCA